MYFWTLYNLAWSLHFLYTFYTSLTIDPILKLFLPQVRFFEGRSLSLFMHPSFKIYRTTTYIYQKFNTCFIIYQYTLRNKVTLRVTKNDAILAQVLTTCLELSSGNILSHSKMLGCVTHGEKQNE